MKLNETPREAAKRIAESYASGALRADLEYEVEAAINFAVAKVTGIPPGPVDPPRPVPVRVA